jgi:hypothetical protein
VTRAAFTIASAASTTAGKPRVSTIPTAIDMSFTPKVKDCFVDTTEAKAVNRLSRAFR